MISSLANNLSRAAKDQKDSETELMWDPSKMILKCSVDKFQDIESF